MIATSIPSKTDYYATNSTASNVTASYDDYGMPTEEAALVWIITRQEAEPEEPPKPLIERTAQRYIDHLWPVVNHAPDDLPGGDIERAPRPRQKEGTYG